MEDEIQLRSYCVLHLQCPSL